MARSERKMIQYLDSIPCVNALENEDGELIWYIRGKTFNEQTRGQIYRARPINKSPLRAKSPNNNIAHQKNNRMSGTRSQTGVPFSSR